jgi:hypothetical protein
VKEAVGGLQVLTVSVWYEPRYPSTPCAYALPAYPLTDLHRRVVASGWDFAPESRLVVFQHSRILVISD